MLAFFKVKLGFQFDHISNFPLKCAMQFLSTESWVLVLSPLAVKVPAAELPTQMVIIQQYMAPIQARLCPPGQGGAKELVVFLLPRASPFSTCLIPFWCSGKKIKALHVCWCEHAPVPAGEEKAASVLSCECFVVNLLRFPSPNSSKAPFKAAAHNRCLSCHRLLFSLKYVFVSVEGRTNSLWESRRGENDLQREWIAFQKRSFNSSDQQQQNFAAEWRRLQTHLSFKALWFCISLQMMALLIAFVSPICGVSHTAARELLGEPALW